jgi:hypothetical protein
MIFWPHRSWGITSLVSLGTLFAYSAFVGGRDSAGGNQPGNATMATRRISFALIAVLALALQASAGVYVPPQPTDISGTTASGLQWSAVATGTALPIRTSATSAFFGQPGAVAYFNTLTGQLQVDPKGYDLNSVIITYTTGTVNISGTTPGPFRYATGTAASAWSPATGTPRTFPAIQTLTGLPPTTFAARVGTTIGSPLSPALTNTGDVGNIASTGPSGYWNLGWSFPLDIVASGSVGSMVISNFKTIGQNSNANANILGYGLGFATFQYGINGVIGNQVGAVIPVVPEPSTYALLGAASLVIGVICRRQRRTGVAEAGVEELA